MSDFNKKMLSFCALNDCYFVPMELKNNSKKPFRRYGWKERTFAEHLQILQSGKERAQDVIASYRNSKHTEMLNHWFDILIELKKQHKKPSKRLLKFRDYIMSFEALALHAGKSKLVIFDCDSEGHNQPGMTGSICNGLLNLQAWCRKASLNFNDFLNTATSKTPSGGYHFFFRYDKSDIKKAVSFLPNVDLITGKNIIIAPYSAKYVNESKSFYEHGSLIIKDGTFIFDAGTTQDIKSLPQNIRDAVIKAQKPKPVPKPMTVKAAMPVYAATDKEKQRAFKLLNRHLNDFRNAQKGQRHDLLLSHVRAVFMFYQYLKDDYTQEDIMQMFTNEALSLGLTSSEIRHTILDAVKFGLSHQHNF